MKKECSCTHDGTSGGNLSGDRHSAPSGGIKAVVAGANKPILLEGGEVIINRESAKRFHEELSRINQAGGGVPIKKPVDKVAEKGGSVDSMTLQTILFDKSKFSLAEAKAWLKKEGYKTGLDEGITVYRFRQQDPYKFNQKSFKSKKIAKGITMVTGKLLEK